MKKLMLLACMTSVAGLAGIVYGQAVAESRPVEVDIWGGVGAMGGDVTYQIGGHYSSPLESGDVRFPLSELKWPINVVMGSVGANLRFFERRLEARGLFSMNLTDSSGIMEDSDWTDPYFTQLKTIYSESDADLTAYIGDAGLRFWLLTQPAPKDVYFNLGVGGGLQYENFDWEASNLDQWYPQNPELGHDRFGGVVATYKAKLTMPYLELAGKMGIRWLTLFGSLGFAPYAMASDEDDHKLRYIRAETDANGTAFKGTLQARCDFTRYCFAMLQGEMLSFDNQGTENDFVYAGEDYGETWSIDHSIKFTQANLTAAVGASF